ncbi:hypothetical protein MNAN1_002654 [Malassezia nana]|uniref:Bromo domain-containing protein n=1 Tax=Malassezia nana TaxID=180528 RepID=A0AAF0J463_9BASI|nr:hypothetical protein MNAN1_002654 [Malassezia nana]
MSDSQSNSVSQVQHGATEPVQVTETSVQGQPESAAPPAAEPSALSNSSESGQPTAPADAPTSTVAASDTSPSAPVKEDVPNDTVPQNGAPASEPVADVPESSSKTETPGTDASAPSVTERPADAPADLPAVPTPADATKPAESATGAVDSTNNAPAADVPADAPADDGLTHMDMAMPHVKYAQNTIRSLKSRREAGAFLQPVDPIALRIPHYTQIIKEPMDLGTIDQKLALTAHRMKTAQGAQSRLSDKLKQAIDSGSINPERDFYTRVEDFERDVFRVFDNCVRFNGADHIFSKNAEVLRGVFEKQRKGLATAVAVAEEQNSPEAKARRNSSSLPTIRRSTNGGRPKREIHPPASRDLPWTEEHLHPASKRAVAARLGKSMDNLSSREQSYWSKVISDELKFCYRVIDDLLKPAHQDLAWVFYDLPAKDFDWAPAYYQIIKNPIALIPIQRKLKSGGHADLAAFDADMQLMFRNCFTFNPPDSDVYIMGARLKDVYETKMQKKPVPPPFPAEDDDDDDDEDGDDDDEMDEDETNAVLVQQLQKQIAELEGTLETLESGKNKNPLLITSTRVALNSVQAALAGALSVAGMTKRKGKKRNASSMDKKAKGDKKKKNSPSKKPRTGTSPTPRKRMAGSDEEDVRTVTFDQKEELAAKITELSDERLEGAIRIINEDKPAGAQGGEDEEIELDIDELSPQTLYKLYKYVVRPKKKTGPELGPNGQPIPASAPIDGRKRGTGGLKKKNLDEDEEAARIARLQQQLQQFNDASASDGPKPAAAPEPQVAAGQHDDLVQSDSSSEDDDDSDSDSGSDMD